MLTKYQALHNMLTIDEITGIEKDLKLFNNNSDFNKHLIKFLTTKSVYVTAGSFGEIELINPLPIPYQSFVDTVLKIKSKDTLMYGGEVSLFKLVAYTVKGHDNLYHQVFKLQVNDYLSE